MKNIFYTTLEKVKNILKTENAPESSLISDVILSINTLLNDRDHLKQKKSLPILEKNKTIQPSISISFFNKKIKKYQPTINLTHLAPVLVLFSYFFFDLNYFLLKNKVY